MWSHRDRSHPTGKPLKQSDGFGYGRQRRGNLVESQPSVNGIEGVFWFFAIWSG